MKIEITKKTLGVIIAIIVVIVGIAAASMLLTTEEIEDDPTVEHELTINTEGEGETLPETGTHTYTHGTEIPVTATPEEDWIFQEWTGDQESTEEEIQITMDSDKEITAHFEEEEDEEDEDDEEETEIEEAFVLEIKSPVGIETVPIGREIQTIYTITNEGETTDTQTVELRVNGETIDSREHTLQPGETQEDTFRWTPQQQEQQMRIGTVRTSDNVIIPATEYPEANTPVETMEAYLWALEKVSFVGAETYTTGEQAQYYRELTQEERSGIRASIEDLKNIPEILEKEVDEEEGTATIHVEITREGCEDEETDYYEVLERKYHFTEEQGEWKIEQIEQIE